MQYGFIKEKVWNIYLGMIVIGIKTIEESLWISCLISISTSQYSKTLRVTQFKINNLFCFMDGILKLFEI